MNKKRVVAFLTAVMSVSASMYIPQNALNIIPDTAITASATESKAVNYTVNMTLMQFQSDEVSMGNASMNSLAHIKVNDDGTAVLEIDMQSMTYLGMDGYLAWMKKVTEVVSENKYHYPTEIKTVDADAVEEYVDVYDIFNSPGSEFADEEVIGKWYPKKLSVPLEPEYDADGKLIGEDEILVQVYVPVMESIMEGGGTKFAVIDIDWDTLEEAGPVAGDVNADGDFNVTDVVLLQKWLLAVPDAKLNDWKTADFYEDDKLDVFDLCLMKIALIEQNNTNNE